MHGQKLEGGGSSPLTSTSEATSGALCPGLGSPVQERNMDTLEEVQRRVTEMFKKVEHLSYDKSQSQLGLFSLKKAQGELESCKCL